MYTALYRQWRPETFDEVVGQQALVRTLKNQLIAQRIGHAYLFCGPRGTGKTTTAKIFARAINCISPTENGPCDQCEICKRLSSDNNMDIVEIDAASNNGVDDIRDLRDKVRFPPSVGRYKVYIVDEVHMLSTGAFNALLKTLEEPPGHIVFILATTEPHKLPATIISRCQRFDFKRITLKSITERLKDICGRIEVEIDDSGLAAIARWAEGGMRDALGLLDQCIAFCGNKITYQDVLSVLGTADQDFIVEYTWNIINGKIADLLPMINRLIEDGRDLGAFLRDLINWLRNVMIVKFSNGIHDIPEVEESDLHRIREQGDNIGDSRLLRALELLTRLEADLKWSVQPRVLFELTMVRLCRPEQEQSLEALTDRIEVLEKQLAEGVKLAEVNGNTSSFKEFAENKIESKVDQGDIYPDFQEKDIPSHKEDFYHDQPVEDLVSEYSSIPVEEDNIRDISVEKDKSVEKDSLKEKKALAEERHQDDEAESNLMEVKALWKAVLNKVKKERLPLYLMIHTVKPQMEGSSSLILYFSKDDGFSLSAVEKDSNKRYLEQVIKSLTKRDIRVGCRMEGEQPNPQDTENKAIVEIRDFFGNDNLEIVDEE